MTIQWQGCYGGSENDNAEGMVQTDNGYLISGTTGSNDGDVSNFHGVYDIWVVSIDSLGNLLWERAYGGSGQEYATNIIKDDFGYYYFGGWVSSNDGDVQSGTHGGFDRWVVKIDIQGNIIWERCYGGTSIDYGGLLKLLNNGNILVYGATTSSDGDVPVNYGFLDNWLMIINPNGDIVENRVYGNIDQNNIFDIIETRDGGFFFASKADVAQGMVQGEPHGLTDVWVVKLDSSMNIEWQKMYGGSKVDYGYQGVLELDDGYIFLSSTNSNDFDVSGYHYTPGENADIWAVRIDTIGNILWQRCLGGSDWEFSGTIHQSEDSGFVIFAETTSNNGDVSGNNSWPGKNDIWMLKLSADGGLEWQECYGGNGNERVFKGVLKKSEHNYVVAGRASHNSGDVDCNLHVKEDFWVFEIKDCSYYMPEVPPMPAGPDSLCTTTDTTAFYVISPAAGAWYYEWMLSPEEAGTITGSGLEATVNWIKNWEGQAEITVRSANDCGYSDWSEVHLTWAFSCMGIGELHAGNIPVYIYPNPARDYVVFEFKDKRQKTKDKNGEKTILISNIFGQLVATLQVKSKKTIWDTRKIKAGMYFYRVNIEGMLYCGKVIVRR
jgi:hypothetical protein